ASHPGASRPAEGGHAIDLLDTATWKEVGRLPLGRAGVGHVSWSKDGSRLAGVSDYRAWAWDVKTGKVLGPTRPGHEGLISAMVFGPDGTLFTASDDHTIRSWDPTTGAPGLELVHDHWVRDLAVSPDGSLVAGSSLRNDLRVWDARTGKPRFKLLGNGSQGGKRRGRFTPDGARARAGRQASGGGVAGGADRDEVAGRRRPDVGRERVPGCRVGPSVRQGGVDGDRGGERAAAGVQPGRVAGGGRVERVAGAEL